MSGLRAPTLWCAAGVAVASGLLGFAAAGQTLDVEHARTLVVGGAPSAARMDRGDGARTGMAHTPLPASGLRIAWRLSLGSSLRRAPLVSAEGDTYVVDTRGEVIAVGRDGTEVWRVATGPSQPGPLALLSDDSVAFVDDAGEAVCVHAGRVRFRVRFGRPATDVPAPLPLDDGGVVVATGHEVSVLDADGGERARTTLAEAIAAPLVSAMGRVIAVTSSGVVWSWGLGSAPPTRVATFGAPIDGGAALADEHTLVAVTPANGRFCAIDLVRGTSAIQATTLEGRWLGPPAMRGSVAYVPLFTLAADAVVVLDARGIELGRTLLGGHPSRHGADGGAAPLLSGPHTPPLVDANGTFVFATEAGGLGAASAAGTASASVELLAGACRIQEQEPAASASSGRLSDAPVVGLAPLPPMGFVAACATGALLALSGAGPLSLSSGDHP